jgi:hypothetical protein
VIRPNVSACSGRPAAPNAIACGNTVLPMRRVDKPALEVGRHQQRQLGIGLEAVQEHGRLVRARSRQQRSLDGHVSMATDRCGTCGCDPQLDVVGPLGVGEAARAHTMKSCPTFSSKLTMRSVFFAHLTPSGRAKGRPRRRPPPATGADGQQGRQGRGEKAIRSRNCAHREGAWAPATPRSPSPLAAP